MKVLLAFVVIKTIIIEIEIIKLLVITMMVITVITVIMIINNSNLEDIMKMKLGNGEMQYGMCKKNLNKKK